MSNLRQILRELGSHLSRNHGFLPASPPHSPELQAAIAIQPNVQIVSDFENFLDATPQAVEFLKDRGIEWQPLGVAWRDIISDDLDLGDTKLGPACSLDNPECESCQ